MAYSLFLPKNQKPTIPPKASHKIKRAKASQNSGTWRLLPSGCPSNNPFLLLTGPPWRHWLQRHPRPSGSSWLDGKSPSFLCQLGSHPVLRLAISWLNTHLTSFCSFALRASFTHSCCSFTPLLTPLPLPQPSLPHSCGPPQHAGRLRRHMAWPHPSMQKRPRRCMA